MNEAFDDHLPPILSKDDLALVLLLREVKDMKENQKDLADRFSKFNEHVNQLRIDLQPLVKIDIVNLNKLLSIKSEDINESISWMNWSKSINKVILPVIFALVVGFALLGLKSYAGTNSQLPLGPNIKSNIDFIVPERFKMKDDLDFLQRI